MPFDASLGHLARTLADLVASDSEQAAFGLALDFCLQASGADMGALFLPSGMSLRLSQSRNLPQAFRQKPPLLARDDWARGVIISTPKTPNVPGALDRAARLSGFQTWASVPIANRDDFHGLFIVASRDLVGFSPEAMDYLRIIALVLSLSLSRRSGKAPSTSPDST